MWVFYIAFVVLQLYFIWQMPPEWRDPKHPDFVLWGVNAIGFTSLILLITCFYRLPNGWLRQTVLYTESAYFSLLAFVAMICVFRQVTYYPLKHMHTKFAAKIFADRKLFMAIVMVCTVLFCGAGFAKMEQLEIAPYSVTIPKSCKDRTVRAALLADIHVGTGASYAQMDRMVEAVNEMDADLIILAGDIADSSSSQEDLAYLFNSISKMRSTYGVYYAEGNHEVQCHYEILPGLQAAGVTVLHDAGEYLPNGLALVGRCDSRKISVTEIRHTAGIDDASPCLVIQHRPQGLRKLAGTADLIVSGHTQDYQFPMCAFYFPLQYDVVEGMSTFGDTAAITTVGVSAWGYHCSWPSGCEVAQIDITFTGGDGNEA